MKVLPRITDCFNTSLRNSVYFNKEKKNNSQPKLAVNYNQTTDRGAMYKLLYMGKVYIYIDNILIITGVQASRVIIDRLL